MREARVVSAVYYGGLLLLVALILSLSLDALLPEQIARPVSRNSEGLVMALLLSAWIQFARPTLHGPHGWPVVAAASAGCLAVAALLLVDGIPTQFRTLNEAFFALAVLVPYVQIARPLPVAAWALPAVALIAPVVGADSDLAVTLAETFAFLLLVPLALDLADRSILEPNRPRRPVTVAAWLVVVVAVPVVLHLVRPDDPQNLVEEVVRYLTRTTEAYAAVVVLHLSFSFLRPAAERLGHRRPVTTP